MPNKVDKPPSQDDSKLHINLWDPIWYLMSPKQAIVHEKRINCGPHQGLLYGGVTHNLSTQFARGFPGKPTKAPMFAGPGQISVSHSARWNTVSGPVFVESQAVPQVPKP